MAAIGTASLVTDYLEGAFSRWMEAKLVEMYLEVGGKQSLAHACSPMMRTVS